MNSKSFPLVRSSRSIYPCGHNWLRLLLTACVFCVAVAQGATPTPQQKDEKDPDEARMAHVRMWFLVPSDRTDVEFGVAPTFSKKMRLVLRSTTSSDEIILLSDPYAYQTTGYRDVSHSNYRVALVQEVSAGQWVTMQEIPIIMESQRFYTIFIHQKSDGKWELGTLDDLKVSNLPSDEQKKPSEGITPKRTLLIFNQLPGCRISLKSKEGLIDVSVDSGNQELLEGFPSKITNVIIQLDSDKGTTTSEVELDFNAPDTSYTLFPGIDIYNRQCAKIQRNCSLD